MQRTVVEKKLIISVDRNKTEIKIARHFGMKTSDAMFNRNMYEYIRFNFMRNAKTIVGFHRNKL